MKGAAVVLLFSLLVLVSGCNKRGESISEPPVVENPIVADDPATWPRSVDEAATRIIASLSEEDKKTVRETPRDQLIMFHMGWGMGIRNSTGLWRGNEELLKDTGVEHPDDASMVIIEAIWERLQKQ